MHKINIMFVNIKNVLHKKGFILYKMKCNRHKSKIYLSTNIKIPLKEKIHKVTRKITFFYLEQI